MPSFRLATDDDLRAIRSPHLESIHDLPHLYVPTTRSDVMHAWGVARLPSLADLERLYPGSLVAPRYVGETASRGELVYSGAEAAAAFLRR